MGSTQSRPRQPAPSKRLAEKVRELSLDRARNNYYHGEDEDPPSYDGGFQDISVDMAEQWEKELLEDPKNRLALAALSSNPATSILTTRAATILNTQIFNTRIPHEGSPVTNQRSSGRCWLFASTNVFRVALMKRHNLESFELSQAYLFFWDKLEKANYFLESVLDTVKEPLDGRLVQTLMASPVGDGGQWDMVANLVEKYGLVPQTLYPDSFNAMNSARLSSLITSKLREDALRLRHLASKKSMSSSSLVDIKASLSGTKQRMLRDVHRILTIMLGPPPSPSKEFTWEYYSADKKFHSLTTTPKSFASELSSPSALRALGATDVHRLFSLVNDPRNEYMRLLTVDRLNNVYGGRPVTYVNVDMSTMKGACIAMLKKGYPIFFGCDVGKYSDGQRGFMDTGLYDYELGFNIRLGMSKAERLRTRESAMTHAMVLTAVHLDQDGGAVRWRVENSWSENVGDKGYFVMSDEWMDEFVYQAVVDPRVVSEEVLRVLKQEAKVLELWDPMGALA